MSDLRKALRASTVGGQKRFKSELVEFVADDDGTLRLPRAAVPLLDDIGLPVITDGKPMTTDPDAERVRQTVEVRQPTVAVRREILRAAEMSVNRDVQTMAEATALAFHTAIRCTYVPATSPDGKPVAGGTERLFDDEDLESLREQPTGGWLDHLGAIAARLLWVDARAVGKA